MGKGKEGEGKVDEGRKRRIGMRGLGRQVPGAPHWQETGLYTSIAAVQRNCVTSLVLAAAGTVGLTHKKKYSITRYKTVSTRRY